LNDQLVYHNEELAEEKIKLKRELRERQYELERSRTERERLQEKLRSLGQQEKEIEEKNEVDAASYSPPQGEEEQTWDMSKVVIKALAVAAVVILMAVVKKKGVVQVAAGAATGAWAWFRTRMRV